MKKLILITSLFASLAASAGELKVLDLPSKEVSGGNIRNQFRINFQDGSASVATSVAFREFHGKGGPTYTYKHYENLVPELALVGDSLNLNVDGQAIVCGTMGETRIFRRPVLNLNGNCELSSRTVKTSEGRRFQVYLNY